jgi:hypothetical protein
MGEMTDFVAVALVAVCLFVGLGLLEATFQHLDRRIGEDVDRMRRSAKRAEEEE